MNALKNILALILFSALFSACGKDNDQGGLRYKESHYTKFEVYAGSPDKGGRLITVKMDSSTYFSPILESFADAMISFENNRIHVGQISILESSLYKFEDGKLYLYNDGLWQYFGYGNTGKLTIRQNYAAYKQNGGSIMRFRGASEDNYSVEEAVAKTPFVSLSNMKKEGDTLVICTRDAYFE